MAHLRSRSINEEGTYASYHNGEAESSVGSSRTRAYNSNRPRSLLRGFGIFDSTMSHRDGRGPIRLQYLLATAVLVLLLFYGGSMTSSSTMQESLRGSLGMGSKQPFKPDPSQHDHPIKRLVAQNQERFTALLEKQSETLEQAVAEYRRRYGRRPPTHFDRWFALAQSHNLVLIDEFDVMMRNLEPFWGIHPRTLHGRMQDRLAYNVPTLTLNSSGVFNGSNSWQYEIFSEWLSDLPWQEMIDSVEVIVNVNDEPTVNAPYRFVQDALAAASTQKTSADGPSPPLELGDATASNQYYTKEDVWPYVRDACDVHDPAAKDKGPEQDSAPGLSFITDVPKSMDPCMHPYIHSHHGIFLSPMNLALTKQLVPVLSVGRPPRFNDVLYPSTFYTLQAVVGLYQEEQDIPWEEKKNNVYWVGNPYSGWATLDNWRLMQRQRMALLCAPGNQDPVELLMPGEQGIGWVKRPGTIWSDLERYFHVNIGKPEVCAYEQAACDQQNAVLKPHPEPVEESMKSKYVLDVDGMSFSGRYYRLLKSRAAVIKQTIFEEWHDDWLVPWVHYIPLSLEAGELGETTRYLIEESEGRLIGERIAAESRDWANAALRPIDEQLVFIRLLMEMERLLSPDRLERFYDR